MRKLDANNLQNLDDDSRQQQALQALDKTEADRTVIGATESHKHDGSVAKHTIEAEIAMRNTSGDLLQHGR